MTHRAGDSENLLADLLAVARQLGVEEIAVDATPTPPTIGVLRDAFDVLGRRELSLLKRLLFSALDNDRIVASYQDTGDRLTINTDSRFWNDPAASM